MAQAQGKEAGRSGEQAAPHPAAADTVTPRGTVAVLVGYAALIAVLWGLMYVTMLERGVS